VFLLDSSGSIGPDNFKTVQQYTQSITAFLDISANAINVGIIEFSDDQYVIQGLTSNGALINSTLAGLTYYAGSTAQLPGLRAAINMLAGGRANADKVIFILTDGFANVPCGCSDCESEWSSIPSALQYTVGQKIVNNPALTSKQKNTDYKNLCNYQLSDGANWPWGSYTCNSCSWNDPTSWCLPCADAVPVANKVNAWSRNSSGIVPPDPDNPTNGLNSQWRVVAQAVGDAMTNPVGAREIQNLNYIQGGASTVSWTNLQSTISTIVDQACNQVIIQVGGQ
jgi:hypothetical protein